MVKFVAYLRSYMKLRYLFTKKTMRSAVAAVVAAVALTAPAASSAQTSTGQIKTDRYITLPMIPDSLTTHTEKVDYLIAHYWDFCDMKKVFSSRAKMGEEFKNYLDLMPQASARGAHQAVRSFLRSIEKQPDDLLFITRTAEGYIHSDTAEYYSDELYVPFAVAVARNKRIDKAIREPYEREARILSATMLGAYAPQFEYTDTTGTKKYFEADTAMSLTAMFFAMPDNPDCTLARARLNSNIKASEYIKEGIMKVMVVVATEPDEKWQSMVATYPKEWEVVAAPDINDIYDIKAVPSFYILDHTGKIVLKNITIEQLITMMELI